MPEHLEHLEYVWLIELAPYLQGARFCISLPLKDLPYDLQAISLFGKNPLLYIVRIKSGSLREKLKGNQ